MDYAQLKNLDTSKLSTAAETAGSLSGSLSGRGGEVSGKADIPAGMWQGGDATAASSLMSPLSSPLYDLSDSASQSKGVLEDLVTALLDAKDRLEDAHDLTGGTPITIGPDGTVNIPESADESDAEDNAEKARQIRKIIEEALSKARQADETAMGALAAAGAALGEVGGTVADGLGRVFGPATSGPMGQFAWGPWGVGQFGNLASIQKGRASTFLPRGVTNLNNMTRAQMARAAMSSKNFVPTAGQSAAHAKWAKWGSRATKFGNVTSVATSGAQQLMSDWNRDDLSKTQKGTRAAYRAGIQGGAAIAGAKGGAALGAAVGSVVPGAGTAVGAAVGGVVGGIGGAFVGSELGGKFVDATVDTVGDAAESVKDGASKAVDGAKEGASKAVDGAKDLASKVPTPW